MENGLEAISKKFDDIEKIYLLEFIDNDRRLLIIGGGDSKDKKLKLIIWNMYNIEEDEIAIELELDDFINKDNLTTRLARTSGNILQIDDSGKIISILKKVKKMEDEEKVRKKKLGIIESPANVLHKKFGTKLNEKQDRNHIIHYYEENLNFEPIFSEKEPWVLDDYERNSYCLYQSELETIQLIVGRTTIQVWHQINSDDKSRSKDELPNRGEPFLEYIWTNGIPVNQERKKTRLRIEKFEYGLSDGKLNDFYLKVYWYERVSKDVNEYKFEINKDDDIEVNIMEKEQNRYDDIEIDRMEKEQNRDDDIEINRMEREQNKDDDIAIKIEKDGTNQVETGKDRVERKIKEIRRQDIIIDKINAIRHACKALEFINKRKKFLVNYTKEHLVSVYYIFYEFRSISRDLIKF
jgi:hypothetical protein